MTNACIYIVVSALLTLIVVIYGLCRKVDKVGDKIDEFQSTNNQLLKFSKNLEALFKVEHKGKKG